MHAKCLFKGYTYICNFDRTAYSKEFFPKKKMFSSANYVAWTCSFCMDFACFSRLNVIFKIN